MRLRDQYRVLTMRRHWRTSLCGLIAIVIGLSVIGLGVWIWQAVYVHTNTLWFNLCYVVSGAISVMVSGFTLMVVGIGLLQAADHKITDGPPPPKPFAIKPEKSARKN
jgi:hypothetical protein